MLAHKNFIDIKAFQTKFTDCFSVGDIVQISEKLDGSNASFQYNAETGELDCFSRTTALDPENTLRGFFGYVKALSAEKFLEWARYRFFGEWNLSHLVKYQPDMVKQFHCFDIYDTEAKCWMPQDFVVDVCHELGLRMVPVFYWGPFISWEHVEHFIGNTAFGLHTGEGVVLKNQSRLNSTDTRLPFVVKLVSAEYKEKAAAPVREPLSLDEIARREYLSELTASIVTENRVEKLLYKAVSDGLLPEGWGTAHMGQIARFLPKMVYDDCVKEEKETVDLVEDFGKRAATVAMSIARKMLPTE